MFLSSFFSFFLFVRRDRFNDRCSDFLFDRVEINAVDWGRSFMRKREVGVTRRMYVGYGLRRR